MKQALALLLVPLVLPASAPSAQRTRAGGSSGQGVSAKEPDGSGHTKPTTTHHGVPDPVLSALAGRSVLITNTDQADDGTQLSLVGPIQSADALGATSAMGHPITSVESPNRDLDQLLSDLDDAACRGDTTAMTAAAQDLQDILLGTTQGRIYDGFAMLNYSRGGYAPDHVPGEYKMKVLRDSGRTVTGMDGARHRVWEVDVNMLWYDGNFDSDTFLLRVPYGANEFDTVNVNYTIYSLVREDFSPTAVMQDYRASSGSQEFGRRNCVQFPFEGFDAVWQPVHPDKVVRMTVALPPIHHQRGVYTWGWRVHPPRIQFLQPIYEIQNAHTGAIELDPQGQSYAARNRALTIGGIGDAAPEKKIWQVCQAVLSGASPAVVDAMLNDPGVAPLGTWKDWSDLLVNQTQLPPEAWSVLAAEGIPQGSFGPYRFVSAYVNNEMYGEGPQGNTLPTWSQGDRFQVKVINLDAHTHYFRNVDFGPRLTSEMRSEGGTGAASHSFETMNFKPSYGAPKVAEAQWRAGWGFRPHFDVIQQSYVFPRAADRRLLQPYTDGGGVARFGFQYSATARGGDFRFNPPPFIIGTKAAPSAFPLREADGSDGIVIGQLTEGYGLAKMCSHLTHPLGGFCQDDLSAYNPHGALNVDTDGDGRNDVLWFPPFLRNPNPAGGDIIPPTSAWKPFLFLNPANGTLFIDPADPSAGYWVDRTFAHGSPVPAGTSLSATIEAPRASGQVFYQFDDLFHDNAIFSPHPK